MLGSDILLTCLSDPLQDHCTLLLRRHQSVIMIARDTRYLNLCCVDRHTYRSSSDRSNLCLCRYSDKGRLFILEEVRVEVMPVVRICEAGINASAPIYRYNKYVQTMHHIYIPCIPEHHAIKQIDALLYLLCSKKFLDESHFSAFVYLQRKTHSSAAGTQRRQEIKVRTCMSYYSADLAVESLGTIGRATSRLPNLRRQRRASCTVGPSSVDLHSERGSPCRRDYHSCFLLKHCRRVV